LISTLPAGKMGSCTCGIPFYYLLPPIAKDLKPLTRSHFRSGHPHRLITGDQEISEEWLRPSDQFQGKLIDSFVAGANEYAGRYRSSISPAFQQVLPVKAADALALFQYTIHYNFMTYQSNVEKLISDWIASKPGEQAEEVHDKVRKASNCWALAPSV
jgi:hypothetical protein